MTRQARSLDVLVAEVNRHAPTRSKVSDGGMGDPAHAARESDHNPNAAGVWRARDITDDPPELDGSDLFHRILNLMREGHPALRSGAYLIHNRKIVSYDRLDEGLRDYPDGNPHTAHVHVSVSTAAAGYDSIRPWNLWVEAEKPVAPKPPALPTIADCVIALRRFAEKSTNDLARERYKDAAESLNNIAGGTRVRVPTTVAGVRDVLAAKEKAGGLSKEQLDRIRSARDLLTGI